MAGERLHSYDNLQPNNSSSPLDWLASIALRESRAAAGCGKGGAVGAAEGAASAAADGSGDEKSSKSGSESGSADDRDLSTSSTNNGDCKSEYGGEFCCF